MSIFSSLKPKATNSRNAFPKDRRDIFSTKTGMLTPCFVEHTIPDSVYDVDSLSILRTLPVQSAPFARMTQNIEYFYVPYSQIYHDFERIYYERGDFQRNTGNVQNPTQSLTIPCFELHQVVGNFLRQYFYLRIYQYVVNSNTYVEDGYVRHRVERMFISRLGAHIGTMLDVHGRLCVEDSMRIFDMLGYGNFLPLCKTLFYYYSNVDKNMNPLGSAEVQGCINYALDRDIDLESAVNYITNAANYFLQCQLVASFLQTLSSRRPNVFALAAYLKVWSDMYRNSQYDNSVNYAYYFNFDYVVNDSQAVVPAEKIMTLLIPRYRQWKKDIFTGSYPTAQFGSVAVASLETPSTIVNAKPQSSIKTVSIKANSGEAYVNGVSGSEYWSVDSGVSAVAIRQAMAFQKYKERILRAGNRAPSLQLALFGDRSRYMEDLYVDFLGATHAGIDFNVVASTADSGSSNVGELASNGVATQSESAFKFHSHDFGVIIGLLYILPESEYEAYMIDPANTYSESFDFYKPDFQNLGLQPVFNFDFNIIPDFSGQYVDHVLGYMARYWPYKVAIDKVHGEFYGSLPFDKSLFANYIQVDLDTMGDFDAVTVGAFSEYVTPRSGTAFREFGLSSLYVDPTCVDAIFYSISNESQSTDQFKINLNHRVRCVLPMSVVGLPQ